MRKMKKSGLVISVLGLIFGLTGCSSDKQETAPIEVVTTIEEPVKIEFALKKIVPPDYQTRFCHQLVYHGRAVCNAAKPMCTTCPIAEYCKKKNVKKFV